MLRESGVIGKLVLTFIASNRLKKEHKQLLTLRIFFDILVFDVCALFRIQRWQYSAVCSLKSPLGSEAFCFSLHHSIAHMI